MNSHSRDSNSPADRFGAEIIALFFEVLFLYLAYEACSSPYSDAHTRRFHYILASAWTIFLIMLLIGPGYWKSLWDGWFQKKSDYYVGFEVVER